MRLCEPTQSLAQNVETWALKFEMLGIGTLVYGVSYEHLMPCLVCFLYNLHVLRELLVSLALLPILLLILILFLGPRTILSLQLVLRVNQNTSMGYKQARKALRHGGASYELPQCISTKIHSRQSIVCGGVAAPWIICSDRSSGFSVLRF